MLALVGAATAASIVACAGKMTEQSPDASGTPPPQGSVPLSGAHTVQRFTLANGLRLLVVEDHSSPTFAYQTWFRVGSRDEVTGKTGLAHLFEHMMFKGTKNHADGQFDQILESNGAEGENAFTSWDYTAYVQELPKSKLELIADLESDRMVNLIVDEKAFKTETDVVQNERRFRNENNPDGMLFQSLYELAFKEHPYHWPVIGYQADLDSMHAPDAVDFYRSFYAPNHATIVVSGDVTANDVLRVVERKYGELKPQPAPLRTIPRERAPTTPRRKHLKVHVETERLLMGYPIPPMVHDEYPALALAEIILSGGKSSRLYKALVTTQIASSASASAIEGKDPQLFLLEATLQKGHTAARAEQIMLSEIARLASAPVSADELARARNQLEFSYYARLDSNMERASFLGRFEALTGNFAIGIDQFKRTKDVTPAQIQKVVAKYLKPSTRSTVTGAAR